MTQKGRSTGEQNAGKPRGTAKKKLYQKPEFRHERVFETMALACGKVDPDFRQCFFNRKFS